MSEKNNLKHIALYRSQYDELAVKDKFTEYFVIDTNEIFLGSVPMNRSVDAYTKIESDDKFVAKEDGKGLISSTDQAKINIIKTDGSETKYLNEAGKYVTISVSAGSVDSIEVVDELEATEENFNKKKLFLVDGRLKAIVEEGSPDVALTVSGVWEWVEYPTESDWVGNASYYHLVEEVNFTSYHSSKGLCNFTEFRATTDFLMLSYGKGGLTYTAYDEEGDLGRQGWNDERTRKMDFGSESQSVSNEFYNYLKANANQVKNYVIKDIATLSDIEIETNAREASDSSLQDQITELKLRKDQIGVFGSYSELVLYTGSVVDGNTAKVLNDESRGGKATYYKRESGLWVYKFDDPDKGTQITVGGVVQATFDADSKVSKEEGKGLISTADQAKVSVIKTDGDGTQVLNDQGDYIDLPQAEGGFEIEFYAEPPMPPPQGTPFSECTLPQIVATADAGLAQYYFNIGDTKEFTMTNGETNEMQIIGFNHDNLVGGGKANMTLQFKYLMDDSARMNDDDVNEGSWSVTKMRNTTMGNVYEVMPSEIKDNIKLVNKFTGRYDSSTTLDQQNTEDKLFLLSATEVGLKNYEDSTESWFDNENNQRYEYYTESDNTKREKSRFWWTRTPSSVINETFVNINSDGIGGSEFADTNAYVAPAFCLGYREV